MATISFDLPPEIAEGLRAELGDLNAVAKEAAVVELYRQKKLSRFELRVALGLARFEVDELLKRHRAFEDSLTWEELQEQQRRLAELLDK